MLRICALSFYCVFALLISKSDIQFRIIRNKDLLIFATISVVLNIPNHGIYFFRNLIPAVLLLLLLHLLFRNRIGAGDLKLFLVLIIWSDSFNQWLQFISLSWVLGGLFAIGYILQNRRFNTNIAFAPFIFVAFLGAI